jgi:prepilin-type N-terminal cleavage/methylation domain-containing protein/prepilin-type processing-associated H-X9-DG protein
MGQRSGFTIIELLTTISIITLLTAISVPVFRAAHRQGRRLLNIRNQREVVRAITLFACEHDNIFPDSVGVAVTASGFRWQDPRKVKTTKPLPRMAHSSVAGYLTGYVDKPGTLFCPSSPTKKEYWEDAWKMADQWNHPDTSYDEDALFGSYCLYWNYTGYLGPSSKPFEGPADLYGGARQSNLLISDYFGYNEWRNLDRFGSCENIDADQLKVLKGGEMHSSYWSFQSRDEGQDRQALKGKLNAGYVDGHVEGYTPAQTVPMEASEVSDGTKPYAAYPLDLRNPGVFYLPTKALKNGIRSR